MRYKLFGHSGLRVSELCLGTMTFNPDPGFGVDEAQSRKIFDAYMEAGGNFIDTANLYGRGVSESMLGDFIAGERERIVLATKYSNNMVSDDPNAGGNHRKNLVQSVDASLKRLKTEYIDLYWVHIWDYTTGVEDVMRALDDLVRAGKVLHVASSNMPAWLVSQGNTIARMRGWTPFSGLQLHYNLVERTCESEFLPMAKQQDMAITPWSPLAGGLLTGKFNRDADESLREGSRIASNRWGDLSETKLNIAEAVSAVAKEIGRSPSQVALNWLRQNKLSTVIPIIGATKVEQVKDNLGCLEFELSDEHIDRLDEVSAPPPTYPASLLASPMMGRMIQGEVADLIDNHHDPRMARN